MTTPRTREALRQERLEAAEYLRGLVDRLRVDPKWHHQEACDALLAWADVEDGAAAALLAALPADAAPQEEP